MATVVQGLVLALRSLSREEKREAAEQVWEDPEFREPIVDLVGKQLRGQSSVAPSKPPASPPGDGSVAESPKEWGRRVVERYLSHLPAKGIRLSEVAGRWARTEGGMWLAFATAKERRRNRWFLGLSEDKVNKRIAQGGVSVILLCQPDRGDLLDFVIPQSKVRELVSSGRLTSSKGQLKINLSRVGDRFHVQIPGGKPLDVTEYKGALGGLDS